MVCLQYEKDFVSVYEGSQRWYGGDQAWFSDPVGQSGGCGGWSWLDLGEWSRAGGIFPKLVRFLP